MSTVVVVEAPTLGEGWLRVSRTILEQGELSSYDAQATREVALLTLVVARPESTDPVIAELGDADWLEWMHRNFWSTDAVAELGDAQSYATRLFDYGRTGRDQIAWVDRTAPPRPGVTIGGDHDVPAAHRHELDPVRQPPRLLDRRRRARARRLRPQPRLRQVGLRQPDRADPSGRARCEGARRPGRAARRACEIGAHL